MVYFVLLGDPIDFFSWLLNSLHMALGGTKKKSSSRMMTYRFLAIKFWRMNGWHSFFSQLCMTHSGVRWRFPPESCRPNCVWVHVQVVSLVITVCCVMLESWRCCTANGYWGVSGEGHNFSISSPHAWPSNNSPISSRSTLICIQSSSFLRRAHTYKCTDKEVVCSFTKIMA